MFQNLTNLIHNARTILILNSKPDADSIGASLALQKMLRALGKTAHSCSAYPIPEYLRFLTNTGTIEVIDPKKHDFLPFDLIITVDTGQLGRATNHTDIAVQEQSRFCCIDHHVQDQDTDQIMDCICIDHHAESTCGLLTDFAQWYEKTYSTNLLASDTAFLLYSGIVSDTDYFGYATVTRETFLRAAKLMEYEFDTTPIILQFRETLSLEAFKFLQRFISKVVVQEDARYAYLKVTKEDLEDSDNLAVTNEATNYMNRALIRIIDSVDFSFVLKEIHKNRTSLGLRAHNNGNDKDLSKIAAYFGGGGHTRAAGAVIDLPIHEVETKITEYLQRLYAKKVTDTGSQFS